jgi:membrane protein
MTVRRALRWLRVEARFSATAARRAAVELFFVSNDFTHAAAIAYYALLSLFPFLLLVIAVLGAVTADDADRTAVLTFVLRYVPAQLDFVMMQLDAFRRDGVQLGVGGALGLIWGSLGVFGAITGAVNEAWGVETPRGFWKHRLVSFVMLLAASGVMLVSLLIVSLVHVARASWMGTVLGQFWWAPALQSALLQLAALALPILAIGLVFYFVPNARTRFKHVWVGAVLTGLLWRGAFEAFSFLVSQSPRLKMLNGSITVVIVFLSWVYLSAVILLYGVEFTAAHARSRRRVAPGAPAAPPIVTGT